MFSLGKDEQIRICAYMLFLLMSTKEDTNLAKPIPLLEDLYASYPAISRIRAFVTTLAFDPVIWTTW